MRRWVSILWIDVCTFARSYNSTEIGRCNLSSMHPVSPTDRIFLLSGAGVSAESGISTFRDAGGLWRHYRIEEVASPEAWHRDPRLVWEFYSMRRRVASAAKPTPAHFALAKLEQTLGDRLFLCTERGRPSRASRVKTRRPHARRTLQEPL